MSLSGIGSQIVSKLGSSDSTIPMAVKDCFDSAGYTYFSYDAGGKVEAKDRFIDEIGSGAIWLFGIPGYKKLIDKTIFKVAKISPEVDVRVIKDKNYLSNALKHAPNENVINELKKASTNVTKTKNLNLLKFALALSLTMGTYFSLTKIKQHITKNNIEKEFLENQKKQNDKKKTINYSNPQFNNNQFGAKPSNNDVFREIHNIVDKHQNIPSFKSSSVVKVAEEFMLNPVKNMLLLDAGISGQRLLNARTKGERQEYAIKEGSFLFFVYAAGNWIKKGIDLASKKLLKAPIDLDAKFLASDLASDILKNKNLQKDISNFSQMISQNKNPNEIINFILSHQDHVIAQVGKKAGLFSVIDDGLGNLKIDTRKYIDSKKVESLVNNLKTFIQTGEQSVDKNKFLNKVKGLKVASTVLNVAICCLCMGYIVPKIMYKHRQKTQNGNNDFHVKAEYEEELQKKYGKTSNP